METGVVSEGSQYVQDTFVRCMLLWKERLTDVSIGHKAFLALGYDLLISSKFNGILVDAGFNIVETDHREHDLGKLIWTMNCG